MAELPRLDIRASPSVGLLAAAASPQDCILRPLKLMKLAKDSTVQFIINNKT